MHSLRLCYIKVQQYTHSSVVVFPRSILVLVIFRLRSTVRSLHTLHTQESTHDGTPTAHARYTHTHCTFVHRCCATVPRQRSIIFLLCIGYKNCALKADFTGLERPATFFVLSPKLNAIAGAIRTHKWFSVNLSAARITASACLLHEQRKPPELSVTCTANAKHYTTSLLFSMDVCRHEVLEGVKWAIQLLLVTTQFQLTKADLKVSAVTWIWAFLRRRIVFTFVHVTTSLRPFPRCMWKNGLPESIAVCSPFSRPSFKSPYNTYRLCPQPRFHLWFKSHFF